MNIILDVALILLLFILVYSGFKRGAVKSVVELAGCLVSALAASVISSFLSVRIYTAFFEGRITEKISSSIEKVDMSNVTGSSIDSLVEALPDYVRNSLDISGTDKTDMLNGFLEKETLSNAQVIEGFIRPVIIKLISVVVTIILFAVFAAIISLITRTFTAAVDVAGLSIANKLAGAFIGFVLGVTIIMMLAFIIYALGVVLPPDMALSVRNGIDRSYLFKLIYYINIPEMIINKFTTG